MTTIDNSETNNLVPLKPLPATESTVTKDTENILTTLTKEKNLIEKSLKIIEEIPQNGTEDDPEYLILVSFAPLQSEPKSASQNSAARLDKIAERLSIIQNIEEEIANYGFVLINRGVEALSKYFARNSGRSNMKIVLVGEKNSGKSTTSIFILNKLLSQGQGRVHFLDTDLGQSTFYVPGTVSLLSFDKPVLSNLGQPYIKEPTLSFFVGEYSPLNFIESYLHAVSNAISFYDSFIRNEPLIISMHGFISNIGENLLYDLLNIVRATHIVFLDTSESKHVGRLKTNIERKFHLRRTSLLSQELSGTLTLRNYQDNDRSPPEIILIQNEFTVNLQATNESKRLRKDEMLAAYFLSPGKKSGEKLEEIAPTTTFKGAFAKICLIEPYQIKYDDFIFMLRKTVGKNEVFGPNDFERCALTFVNSVVAMYNQTERNKSREPHIIDQVPLRDVCAGFAYIKDADLKSRTLYIVTPVQEEALGQIFMFVKSTEVNFSTGFLSKQSKDLIHLGDISYDMKGVFDPQEKRLLPNYFINSVNVVGSEPYRSKVAVKKTQG